MTGIGSSVRVDHAVVSGTFSLDGETFDVDNNIWVVGDDTECVVIDAPHDVDAIDVAHHDEHHVVRHVHPLIKGV